MLEIRHLGHFRFLVFALQLPARDMGFQSHVKVGSAKARIDDGQENEGDRNDVKSGHGLSDWNESLDLWSMIHSD